LLFNLAGNPAQAMENEAGGSRLLLILKLFFLLHPLEAFLMRDGSAFYFLGLSAKVFPFHINLGPSPRFGILTSHRLPETYLSEFKVFGLYFADPVLLRLSGHDPYDRPLWLNETLRLN
jgi:hypothetical protein